MKKMNKKGLTLIELIVSLGLLSIILIFLINFFLTLRTTFNKANSIERFEIIKNKFITYINGDADKYGLLSVTKKDSNTMEFKYLADENKNEFTKELKYISSRKTLIYSCSTCSSDVKLSNLNDTLPSNFTFTSLNVEEENNIFKITFVGQIDGKQRSITIYPRKTNYSSGNGNMGNPNIYPTIEDVLGIDPDEPGPYPPPVNPDGITNIIERPSPDGTCTNTLAYDGTIDDNLRYVGKNPCNYIKYNDELWRIVGKMNNVPSDDGYHYSMMKIVRKDSIGKYAWDASGINDWTKSDLMQELNGDYINYNLSANTSWYVNGDTDGNPTGVFNFNRRLKNGSGISFVKWNLGTGNDSRGDTASISYSAERSLKTWGTESGQTCNDGACPRAKSWAGKIGLLYPSDYGFAVGGDVREECLQNGMFYQSEMSDDCHNNNWIGVKLGQWYITPSGTTPDYCGYSTSFLYMKQCNTNADVFPAAYLENNTYFTSGTGTETDPYTIDFLLS